MGAALHVAAGRVSHRVPIRGRAHHEGFQDQPYIHSALIAHGHEHHESLQCGAIAAISRFCFEPCLRLLLGEGSDDRQNEPLVVVCLVHQEQ